MNNINSILITNSSIIWALISVVIIYIMTYFAVLKSYSFSKENKIPDIMVAVASGIMMTILFLHLLQEVYESQSAGPVSTVVLALLSFFILSLISHSHSHEHKDESNHIVHNTSKVMMIGGQSIHSLADGIVIISGWIASPLTGVMTSVAIALHHIPMMMGLGSKYKSTYSRKFILSYTLYATMSMGLGILFAKFIYGFVSKEYFIAIAAASFAHIAILDMFGHVRDSQNLSKKYKILFIILGMILAYISELSHGH
jgi:zinc and cadmium transporter